MSLGKRPNRSLYNVSLRYERKDMNNMKKDLIEMVFIMDRSGSMSGLEKQTIEGFNNMVLKQKEVEGDAVISTVLFSDFFEVVHQRIPINHVRLMTKETYYVKGTTALLDAIGRAIKKISFVHKTLSQSEIPEKTIFVITTDGLENASVEFSPKNIKNMIENQKEQHQWEFIFLGANIDSVTTARDLGIDENRVANYHADEEGTKLNYDIMSNTITSFRRHSSINDSWKNEIDEDFKHRTKK